MTERRVGCAVCLCALALAPAACARSDLRAGDAAYDVDALPRLTLHEEIRIGSVEDPDYGFSRIGSVDVDRDGNVYLFEGQDRQIRVYAPDGRLLRRIGRSGAGPGEFTGGISFGITGDTVWAVETSRRRLTLFRTAGTLIHAVTFDRVDIPLFVERNTAMIMPVSLGDDGLFIGTRGPSFIGTAMDERAAVLRDTVHVPRVRFNTDGRVVDTIGSYPIVRREEPTEYVDVGSSTFILPRAFAGEPMIIPVHDGVIRIEDDLPPLAPAFRVTRLDHAGDTIRATRYGYRPQPYPESVLDAAIARSVQSGRLLALTETGVRMLERRPEDSAAAAVAVRRRMSFPEHQSPVRSYAATAHGALWLQREDTGGDTFRWTVLDTLDAPIGELELPRSMRLAWLGADTVWAVERDDFDVPWLVRYRLERPRR